MDTYFLNNSTRELEAWMKTTENPHYEGISSTATGSRTAGAGQVTTAERLKEMAQYIVRHKPEDGTTPWWKY